jgi:predicted TIM-barrel fold metal-dependent hydrolase
MPEGHVYMGTDYPYDMADTNPVGSVEEAVADDTQRKKICSENIAAILGLS